LHAQQEAVAFSYFSFHSQLQFGNLLAHCFLPAEPSLAPCLAFEKACRMSGPGALNASFTALAT